jgi:hypothetical protein
MRIRIPLLLNSVEEFECGKNCELLTEELIAETSYRLPGLLPQILGVGRRGDW